MIPDVVDLFGIVLHWARGGSYVPSRTTFQHSHLRFEPWQVTGATARWCNSLFSARPWHVRYSNYLVVEGIHSFVFDNDM